ncbi:isochorismatase family protein [Candidatus Colwellia aromaticivorans]|uniref:isochorismatase family protein n=1 Tax=Candidatus Colwellia aromaticivorans TaxID=2267621 RepID=UPI000DF48FF1|nr:isochorismatase family protein [Candidatus Colwellia aromaticivorans]
MLQKEDCGLIVVDVQGSLARIVQQSDLVIENTKKLIQCCKLLSIPIIWLEQNPKGLGATVPELSELMGESIVNEKVHFNALFEQPIKEVIKATDKKRWLVVGIEAHVCVYQTVLGLLNENYKVDVVSDCISSRLQSNIDLALLNMRESGASITSLEMCVFEMMKSAKINNFREILSVIK